MMIIFTTHKQPTNQPPPHTILHKYQLLSLSLIMIYHLQSSMDDDPLMINLLRFFFQFFSNSIIQKKEVLFSSFFNLLHILSFFFTLSLYTKLDYYNESLNGNILEIDSFDSNSLLF